MGFVLETVFEIKLNKKQIQDISCLLELCFDFYPKGQICIHQIPHLRFLMYNRNQLISHAALHLRKVVIDTNHVEVLGISDLCLHPEFRNQGFGNRLLDSILSLAYTLPSIKYIVCFTTEPIFYLKKGFKLQSGIFKWLLLNQLGSLGVAHRRLNNEVLVFSLDGQDIKPNCRIDLQGPPF